jgi:hypothetical protein
LYLGRTCVTVMGFKRIDNFLFFFGCQHCQHPLSCSVLFIVLIGIFVEFHNQEVISYRHRHVKHLLR